MFSHTGNHIKFCIIKLRFHKNWLKYSVAIPVDHPKEVIYEENCV